MLNFFFIVYFQYLQEMLDKNLTLIRMVKFANVTTLSAPTLLYSPEAKRQKVP